MILDDNNTVTKHVCDRAQMYLSHLPVNNGGSDNEISPLVVLVLVMVAAQQQILGILAATVYNDSCSRLIVT